MTPPKLSDGEKYQLVELIQQNSEKDEDASSDIALLLWMDDGRRQRRVNRLILGDGSSMGRWHRCGSRRTYYPEIGAYRGWRRTDFSQSNQAFDGGVYR